MGIKLWLLVSILAASFTTVAAAQDIDWKKVDDTFDRKPVVGGDVHRYGFPRTSRLWRSADGSRSSLCMARR